jgi:hypothetical protein
MFTFLPINFQDMKKRAEDFHFYLTKAKRKKKLWEELIVYFPLIRTQHIENEKKKNMGIRRCTGDAQTHKYTRRQQDDPYAPQQKLGGNTQIDRHHCDLLNFLLFFRNKESRLKEFVNCAAI